MVDGAARDRPGRRGRGARQPERAKELAGICALNAIAAVKSVVGDLDRVERVVKVVGFVASDPSFTGQPGVVNGASEPVRRGVRRGRGARPLGRRVSRRCRSTPRWRSRSSSTSGTDGVGRPGGRASRPSGPVVHHPISRDPGLGRRARLWLPRRRPGRGRRPPRRHGDDRARRWDRPGGLRAASGRDDGVRAVDGGLPRRRRGPGRPRARPVDGGAGRARRGDGGHRWRWPPPSPRPPCARSRRSAGCGSRWPTCAGAGTG